MDDDGIMARTGAAAAATPSAPHAAPRKRVDKRMRCGAGNRITVTERQRFLNALALTCDVRRAAQHAGRSITGLYQLRARDAAFAQQWRWALDSAYDRLEALILAHVGAALPLLGDPEQAVEEGVAADAFEFEKAMRMLAAYRAERGGAKPPAQRAVGNASREETNAVLRRALAAATRRQAKREAEAARLAAPLPLVLTRVDREA